MIDTTFDFRLYTPEGKDPDTYSPTLCKYHQQLWSKPLPCGEALELTHKGTPYYHFDKIGPHEIWLSGDAVIPSFQYLPNIDDLVSRKELEDFETIGYTIGGMMVFPANQIDRKWTINPARGCSAKIKDRFDLTLECIRLHYLSDSGSDGGLQHHPLYVACPLFDVLERYRYFFELFVDLRGYVDFFHLQDLVSEDYRKVKLFLPFDDFRSSPIPQTREEYHLHRIRAIEFIEARNQRIADYCNSIP